MDKRLIFNEDAVNYDKWRPRYCGALFSDIIQYSQISNEKHAVEIGCGTGQATEPILKTGCVVTAIELGGALALFAQTKFENYSNFQVCNIAFEEFQCECNRMDLVYSATAFHWIPEETGYKKAYNMLKKNGTIALFWNKPGSENDLTHQKLQTIYEKYMAEGKFSAAETRAESKQADDKDSKQYKSVSDTILQYGFVDLESHRYKQTRTFTAENYVSLLDTYSDHRSMQVSAKKQFYEDIKAAINSSGGRIHIYDTMDLYLARKP